MPGGAIGMALDILVAAAAYAMLAISMNIDYGWAGIPDFGKAAFIAAGGAMAAIVATQLGPMLFFHHPPVVPGTLQFFGVYNGQILPLYQQEQWAAWAAVALAAVLGGILAAILGVVFTLPAVRLREDYLAIALLMAAQLVWLVIRVYKPIMGGTMSLALPSPNFQALAAALGVRGNLVLAGTALKALFMWGMVALFYFFAEHLLETPFGRKLRAVRDDEAAAEALGKNVPLARLEAMVYASFLAGVAGALYVMIYFGAVNPDNFLPDITFFVLAMVLVGGVGNNLGAIVGALLAAGIFRVADIIGSYLSVNYGIAWGSYLYYLAFGALILAVIFLRPRGLLPEGPVRTPAWRVFRERLGFLPPQLQPLRVKLARLLKRGGGE